ncbi:MAG: flagellar hook-length control protein FliK [Rhodospirillaceae bacterium]
MNDYFIKPTKIFDAPSSKSTPLDKADRAAALAALASSFRDLLHRVGSNVDTGLNSIAEQRGITAVSETRKPSENYGDTHSDRDSGADDCVARVKDEPKTYGRDDGHRNYHGDDNRRAPEAVDRGERLDNRQSAETNTKDDGLAESVEKSERPSGDAKDGDKDTVDNTGAKSESTGADKAANGSQSASGGKSGPATQGAQQTDVSATLASIVEPAAGLESAVAVATANAQGLVDDGPADDTAKFNAAAGLAAAVSNAKGNGVHSADTGRQQSSNAAAQQTAANGQNQNQAETATRGQAGIQQQAQQIARALGDDVRMQINVDVADEAESLTSRPMTTLAAGAAVGDQGKGQNQNGQQQTAHASAPGQAQAAVAGNAQTQNGQAQGQNQQANAQLGQAQGVQQAGADAKGPAAASTTAHNAAAPNTSGGGEGTSSSSGVSGSSQTQQTQQSQHTSQTQQAQAARGQHNGPSAAEQVSVRITRALQAGNDRISIRLNPAELGRVEVKVELSHDGRMTAVVTADKPETLETLRRDASELQKALQQGGIDLSSGDLAFNLRGEHGQTADGGDGNAGAPANAEGTADATDINPEVALLPSDIALGEGRVDVRA